MVTFELIYFLYIGTFEVAVDFINSHRRKMPPIYNYRRIKEMPLPSLGLYGTHLDQFHASNYFNDSTSEGTANESFVEHDDNNIENDTSTLNELHITTVNESVLANSMVNNDSNVSTEPIETVSIPENSLIVFDASVDGNDSSKRSVNTIDPLANNISNVTNEKDESVLNGENPSNEFGRVTDTDDLLAGSLNTVDPLANTVSNIEDEQEASLSNASTQEALLPSDEPLTDETTNGNVNEVDPLENGELENRIKTECVPLYEMHARNSLEMDELLDEPEVVYLDDDLEMVVSETGLPKPFSTTGEYVVKRENDAISGEFPFNIEVSISN